MGLAGGADGSIVVWRLQRAKDRTDEQELLWHALRNGPIIAVAISKVGLVVSADDYEPTEGGLVGGTAKFLARKAETGISFEFALPSSCAETCMDPSCDTWNGEWRMKCSLCSKTFPTVNALTFGPDCSVFYGGYGQEVYSCKDLYSKAT